MPRAFNESLGALVLGLAVLAVGFIVARAVEDLAIPARLNPVIRRKREAKRRALREIAPLLSGLKGPSGHEEAVSLLEARLEDYADEAAGPFRRDSFSERLPEAPYLLVLARRIEAPPDAVRAMVMILQFLTDRLGVTYSQATGVLLELEDPVAKERYRQTMARIAQMEFGPSTDPAFPDEVSVFR